MNLSSRRSLFFAPLLILAVACSKPAPAAPAGGNPGANIGAVPVKTTPEIDAKLVAADKKDGKEDKVVGKCAGCDLGMDGKAEFALPVGAYQMHFCGQHCLDRYKKDAIGELTKLVVK